MRIAVMGKGGSGKTTISAALVGYLAQRGRPVLAVDADVNAHLGAALGMNVVPLQSQMDEIKAWLEPGLVQREMPVIGTTPPSSTSRFVKVRKADEFLDQFATWNDDATMALLTVGSYEAEHAGTECYHGMLKSAELPLHRTLDSADDAVVIDCTAGVDSVGTSMYFAADVNVFVVEPTVKSVGVYEDFRRVCVDLDVNTVAIGNKVHDETDRRFLGKRIGAQLIGTIEHSESVRRAEQGEHDAMAAFSADHEAVWNQLVALCPDKRDWDKYLRRLHGAYRDNGRAWYDDFYGRSLEADIDHDFRYSSVTEA